MFFEKETISFNIINVFRLRQENVSVSHKGRKFTALAFRLSSDAVLKTEKQEYRMKEHYISYVPAGLDYSRYSKTEDLIAIHFDTISYQTEEIECFLPGNPAVLEKLFKKIWNLWNEKKPGYRFRCSAVLCEIFAECYTQSYTESYEKSKIQGSVEYLLNNYQKSELTIKEIAEKSFMSEVYFRKLFKEQYGVSPQKYIIDLRIQNAADLISTGGYSLKEIAYMSGYSDYKYFSVEFKKKMGMSPSEYRYDYEYDELASAPPILPKD